MPISNGSFETGDGGIADNWTVTVYHASLEFFRFITYPISSGYETFDRLWSTALISEFEGLGVDLDIAIFVAGSNQRLYEDFLLNWGPANLITIITRELALFNSPTDDNYEDFEADNWGVFYWVLGSVVVGYFNGSDPEDSFEENWQRFGSQTLIPVLPYTYATFDNTGGGGGAADTFEPFDDTAWPTLTL